MSNKKIKPKRDRRVKRPARIRIRAEGEFWLVFRADMQIFQTMLNIPLDPDFDSVKFLDRLKVVFEPILERLGLRFHVKVGEVKLNLNYQIVELKHLKLEESQDEHLRP